MVLLGLIIRRRVLRRSTSCGRTLSRESRADAGGHLCLVRCALADLDDAGLCQAVRRYVEVHTLSLQMAALKFSAAVSTWTMHSTLSSAGSKAEVAMQQMLMQGMQFIAGKFEDAR
mmetsp:Transcript_53091/g.172605  ORF Transcript_53091/g.172605 Transcript_53091/m.172605 type:complete len:116 (-) Transcript_53091:396-743(-)